MDKLTDQELIKAFKESLKDKKLKDFLYHYFKNHFEQFCMFVLPEAFTCGFTESHRIIAKKLFSTENSADALPRGWGKAQSLDCNILTPKG